jgi:hypothetical protein
VRRPLLLALATLPALGAAACKPDLGAPLSLVDSPRLLAVRGTPAEAAPGTPVTYDSLSVDGSGVITDPQLTWSLCHIPKPPAEANAVSDACLTVPDDAGPEPTYMALMPDDPNDPNDDKNNACKLFGPIAPDPVPGQPPISPRAPDITGGFYQPVRVSLTASERAFYLERIRCNLANAPRDVVATFNMTYTNNLNPTIARLTLDPDGAATMTYEAGMPAAAAASVSAGSDITLEAAWTDDSPETYPVWDLVARQLETRREAMRLSWFATAGDLEHETTGRTEEETETTTRNTWKAPADAGLVHFWAVLRDSRGGVDFAAFDVMVTP